YRTSTLSLHDALPISGCPPMEAGLEVGHTLPPEQAETLGHHPVLRHVQPSQAGQVGVRQPGDRLLPPQVRLDENRPAPDGRRARSEEHTSELQSLAYL